MANQCGRKSPWPKCNALLKSKVMQGSAWVKGHAGVSLDQPEVKLLRNALWLPNLIGRTTDICDPTRANEVLWGRYQNWHFKFNILFNIQGTFWHQNDFHIIFLSKVTDILISNCLITLKINYQDMGRPGKNVYFPASWAKFPSSRVDFPPVWDGFPYVFLYFFPPNHKISRQGASRFAYFFQAWIWAGKVIDLYTNLLKILRTIGLEHNFLSLLD